MCVSSYEKGYFVMEYINQYDYPHIPYPHPEGVYTDKEPTIALCGCGLCSLWMVIRMLTEEKPSLEDLIQMSIDSGANVSHGTQMRILAPYAAKKYGLQCTLSTVCVADPALKPGKFDEPGREGKVRTDEAPLLYVNFADLVKDSYKNGKIAFSILSKK